VGEPDLRICEFAQNWRTDLIVLGRSRSQESGRDFTGEYKRSRCSSCSLLSPDY